MIEKAGRGAIGHGPSGGAAAAPQANPARFQQGVDCAARHSHAADLLDFGARGGLVVGNDRQCFHGRAAQFFRLLRAFHQQPGQISGGAKSPFLANAHQFNPAPGILRPQNLQQLPHIAAPLQARGNLGLAHRFGTGKQHGLDNAQGRDVFFLFRVFKQAERLNFHD